jgi:hypothetical protein
MGVCTYRVQTSRIHGFGPGPRTYDDSAYNAAVRSKNWVFALTEYRRVIFMDSDQMVIRNIDHYFFTDYYMYGTLHVREADGSLKPGITAQNRSNANAMPHKGRSSSTVDVSDSVDSIGLESLMESYSPSVPKKLYAQSSMHSPVNAGFMSVEPNQQILIDLRGIYETGNWDYDNGWLNYGSYKFDFLNYTHSFVNPTSPWLTVRVDPLYPYLPLYPYPTERRRPFYRPHDNWSFYGCWSDQGLIFLYFLLLRDIGGLFNGTENVHEVIHFFVSNVTFSLSLFVLCTCLSLSLCLLFQLRVLYSTCNSVSCKCTLLIEYLTVGLFTKFKHA